jgi:uncharacterized protein (TIGR02594 family)
MSAEPSWLEIARRYVGVREVPGPGNNPVISSWLAKLRAWWTDDATPWCGVFMAHVMQEAGLPYPKEWYRARAWESWGTPLTAPALGCVVAFTRQGGGHVGLVVGQGADGSLLVLGGNQGDAVNVRSFPRDRVTAYRWPAGLPLVPGPLPTTLRAVPKTTGEA